MTVYRYDGNCLPASELLGTLLNCVENCKQCLSRLSYPSFPPDCWTPLITVVAKENNKGIHIDYSFTSMGHRKPSNRAIFFPRPIQPDQSFWIRLMGYGPGPKRAHNALSRPVANLHISFIHLNGNKVAIQTHLDHHVHP